MARRNVLHFLLGFVLVFLLSACAHSDNQNQHVANQDEPINTKHDNDIFIIEATFNAIVVETENGLMVTPLEDEGESKSSDLIFVGTNDAQLLDNEGNEIHLSEFKKEMTVEIVYDGKIMESYPAQIRSFQVQIIDNGLEPVDQTDIGIAPEVTFTATVTEVKDYLLIAEDEGKSADLIMVHTDGAKLLDKDENEISLSDFKAGMSVEIMYNGIIMYSSPAQINSFQVQIIEEK